MGLAVDGLVSGMKTTELINSLIQVESIPQSLLKKKVSTTQSAITALQDLNSKISALATLATSAAKPDALNGHTVTSSSPSVSATASTGANAGRLDLVVDKLAQSQVTVSAAVSTWPDSSLAITGSDGTVTNVAFASTSLDDVAKAINASAAGVTATKVAAGTDSVTGEPLYRLQFTSATTGADAAFSFSGSTVGMTGITSAQDAEVVLWKGTAAEQVISSATNTFADILPGVSVTVKAASADPVSLTVSRDATAATAVAKGFVGSLTEVFALISTKSVVTTTTTNGVVSVNGGVFTGDSTVRGVKQSLLAAASMPVNGVSPSEIGISITKTGTLEFDDETFAKALAADPDKVRSIMQELASRVAASASQASDKSDGSLTSKITGQETLAKDYTAQVAEWDDRLANRRTSLERTYSAMEVRLSTLNAQASYLTSQLASLPSTSGNSK
jgi:flagellar hook-associated protein 2